MRRPSNRLRRRPQPRPRRNPHRLNPHRPIAAPSWALRAPTLYFDVGSADLPADSTGGLEPIIAYLKANPSTTAVVSGYHDPSGDAAVNEELAKNRALAVQIALEGAGIELRGSTSRNRS